MFYRLLLVILIFNLSYNQSLGSITGSVIDKETHQPIRGVNLILINTILGTASDQNGNFLIDNIKSYDSVFSAYKDHWIPKWDKKIKPIVVAIGTPYK